MHDITLNTADQYARLDSVFKARVQKIPIGLLQEGYQPTALSVMSSIFERPGLAFPYYWAESGGPHDSPLILIRVRKDMETNTRDYKTEVNQLCLAQIMNETVPYQSARNNACQTWVTEALRSYAMGMVFLTERSLVKVEEIFSAESRNAIKKNWGAYKNGLSELMGVVIDTIDVNMYQVAPVIVDMITLLVKS